MKVLIVLCLAALALADEKKSHDAYDKHDGYVSNSSGSKFWKSSEIQHKIFFYCFLKKYRDCVSFSSLVTLERLKFSSLPHFIYYAFSLSSIIFYEAENIKENSYGAAEQKHTGRVT